MAMKRANGTGSVHKMKHKTLRKPFRAVRTLGWTDEGKAIRKTIGYFEKAKDAWSALELYNINPQDHDVKKILFKTAWQWMKDDKLARGYALDGTYDMAETRLAPLMGYPMSELRTPQLQDVINLNASLSMNSLKNLKSKLTATYKIAIIHDVISKNYASNIIIPKKDEANIHKPYSAAEIEVLWTNKADEDVQLVLIYLYTGMRSIELVNMEIKQVNLKDRYMIGGSKTDAGKTRVIPIANCIHPFIEHFYTLNRFKKTLLGDFTRSTIEITTARVGKKYGLSRHLPHDTRHTFITMCSNTGIPDVITKLIVGHAKGNTTTEKVYTHKTTEQLIHAVNLLPYGESMDTFYTAKVE